MKIRSLLDDRHSTLQLPMARLETKPLLPLGNDHSLHCGESFARRLLSIPREVIPLSLFAFGGRRLTSRWPTTDSCVCLYTVDLG